MGSAGEIVGGADAAAQMRKALENVRVAVDRLGGSMEDVVRTRVYLKDIQHWESVGRVHREAFGTTPPASTMVEVHGFVSPDILVEIEAEAIVEDPRRRVRRHLARRRIPFRRSGHRP
jgi:enamine deaminase RidA (YjgF/YER057c/UK114 family)